MPHPLPGGLRPGHSRRDQRPWPTPAAPPAPGTQARVYSLIRPLRTDLRRIRSVSRPITVALGSVQFVRHALRYALVRPGRAVVHLVFDQNGAKV
jgi:hypothetical protein